MRASKEQTAILRVKEFLHKIDGAYVSVGEHPYSHWVLVEDLETVLELADRYLSVSK